MTDHKLFASDEEIFAIVHGIIERTLPKPQWTHAAHFAAAVGLLSQQSIEEVGARMPGLIRAYNESTGVANTDSSGYHETITQASLRAARSFLNQHPHLSLHEALNALLASPYGRSDWLLRYWSKVRLFSVEARRQWCEPDLASLPF